MNDPSVWEIWLRGMVAGVLLFHVAQLLWPGPHRRPRLALTGFALALLAYLLCSMPVSPGTAPPPGALPPGALLPVAPPPLPLLALCMAGPALLWLAVRAVFDDSFTFSPLVIALVAAALLGGAAVHVAGAGWPRWHAVAMAGFVGAALWEIGRGWRADLVEPRRAARRWVALGIGLYAAVVLAVEWWLAGRAVGRWLPALHVAGIGSVALALAVVVARRSLDELFGPPLPADSAAPPQPVAPAAGATEQRLLDQVMRAMTEQHAYRSEGLTLAAFAELLGTSDAALRCAVNQRLGYRNFNDFLHHYRLQEAMGRLAREDLPVLTIALECGYGSIGPFNRAFKLRTGMTPTEYRAAARMSAAAGQPRPIGAAPR